VLDKVAYSDVNAMLAPDFKGWGSSIARFNAPTIHKHSVLNTILNFTFYIY
jgi:hypothetical protein